jgi:hypothetical protein
VDLGHFELKKAAQEVLVGAADIDQRTLGGAPNLEHVCLDVLANSVVLARALVGGRKDRLGPSDVEDDAAWLYTAHRAGDDLRLTLGVLAKDLLALNLAQSLAEELRCHLGVDSAEGCVLEITEPDQVANLGIGLDLARLVDGEFDRRILDLVDDVHRAIGLEAAGVGIPVGKNVLVAGGGAAVCGLDGLAERGHELLARNVLLGVQLQERAGNVAVHAAPSFRCAVSIPR